MYPNSILLINLFLKMMTQSDKERYIDKELLYFLSCVKKWEHVSESPIPEFLQMWRKIGSLNDNNEETIDKLTKGIDDWKELIGQCIDDVFYENVAKLKKEMQVYLSEFIL